MVRIEVGDQNQTANWSETFTGLWRSGGCNEQRPPTAMRIALRTAKKRRSTRQRFPRPPGLFLHSYSARVDWSRPTVVIAFGNLRGSVRFGDCIEGGSERDRAQAVVRGLFDGWYGIPQSCAPIVVEWALESLARGRTASTTQYGLPENATNGPIWLG
jgi:hypothetical protein